MAQLFGHNSEHREFAFFAYGVVERKTMLLNRAEFSRGLRAHDITSAEERVTDHLLCVLESLLACVLTDFNNLALELADFRHQLERRNAFKVVIPVLH